MNNRILQKIMDQEEFEFIERGHGSISNPQISSKITNSAIGVGCFQKSLEQNNDNRLRFCEIGGGKTSGFCLQNMNLSPLKFPA